MRSFGSGHREQTKSAKLNTTINIPTKEDLEKQLPFNDILNDRFLFWVNGKFPVDRLSDKLINDKVNKYSAYYYYGTKRWLQNRFVL
jgi:hypothetical protein